MANKLTLEVVTPDRKVLSQDVEYVGAPGSLGEFGVLPGHIPYLSALGVGNLYFKDSGRSHYVFVAGGFAEVSKDKVTILAEVAERAEEIDMDRARKAQDRAHQRMVQRQEDMDFNRAQVALQRAVSRLACIDAAKNAGTFVK